MPECSGTELSAPLVKDFFLHDLVKHSQSQHGSIRYVHLEEERQFPVSAQKGPYEIKPQV